MSSAHCIVDSSAHSPIFLSLHLRQSSFSNLSIALPTSQLILQPFRCFIYVTGQSPTLPLLHLRHSSFSNPSVASPTSQLILQPFFRVSYVTGFSLTSPGEPPMIPIQAYRKKVPGRRPGAPWLDYTPGYCGTLANYICYSRMKGMNPAHVEVRQKRQCFGGSGKKLLERKRETTACCHLGGFPHLCTHSWNIPH